MIANKSANSNSCIKTRGGKLCIEKMDSEFLTNSLVDNDTHTHIHRDRDRDSEAIPSLNNRGKWNKATEWQELCVTKSLRIGTQWHNAILNERVKNIKIRSKRRQQHSQCIYVCAPSSLSAIRNSNSRCVPTHNSLEFHLFILRPRIHQIVYMYWWRWLCALLAAYTRIECALLYNWPN